MPLPEPKGTTDYWRRCWRLFGIGASFYFTRQFTTGLGITGLGRDVSWGFYVAQFTYLVGVAASAVMVVLPYYLHNYKAFGRVTILGEFLAVAAVTMCLLFIVVDMGRPDRVLNVIKYPTPGSILFWDMIVLNGYLILNILIGWNVLESERHDVPPPHWVKMLSYVSIPWAVSIHTVTAFLYAGLPGRGYWLTAVMAPRFLVFGLLRRAVPAHPPVPAGAEVQQVRPGQGADPDPGQDRHLRGADQRLPVLLRSLHRVLQPDSGPHAALPIPLLRPGRQGRLVPLMWFAIVGMTAAALLMVNPAVRKNEKTLAWVCGLIIITTYIDKGLGLMTGGFVPNPLEQVGEYWPTVPEALITLGIWALGFFILSVLYKVAISIKEEVQGLKAS